MSSVTLAQSALLAQDMLVAGVIENIITVNRMFEVLPFDGVEGNALAYNRELTLGDVVAGTVGTTLTDSAGKTPATFTQVTSSLTTILGDAEVNGLIQATRSDNGNDQTAVQIASKSKAAGRMYQDMLINGTGSSNQFAGLLSLVASSQKTTPSANGDDLSFALLDELLDLVVDKDGQVDWISMPARTLRSYRALLRALGGAGINEVVAMPSGAEVPAYNGVPIFRNDYIPVTQTQGSATTATTVLAGTFDDGSRQHGISGLTAAKAAGIKVVDVGESIDSDDHIYRVKWYCGLANFSAKGLAALPGILN